MTVNKDDWVVKQSEAIMKLMAEGKSMEEALRATQHFAPTTIGDRIEYIKSLNSIAAVRRQLHLSASKLSKSKGKESEPRYKEEIETAKARLNELMAQVGTGENPLKKALELGETPSGIVQLIVIEEEKIAKDKLDIAKKQLKWTNKALKLAIGNQPATTPPGLKQTLLEISPEVSEIYETRQGNGDQRVITLSKRLHLLDELYRRARKAEETRLKAEGKADVKVETPKKMAAKEK